MNILFAGTSRFALHGLSGLIEAGYDISCVITAPDKKQGRGLHCAGSPVKEFAKEKKLRLFQPEDINSAESVAELRSLKPDLLVVIAYGQKLSDEVLALPGMMPVNVHASLLPRYRGAGPINWAIIRGEKKTGNTLMKMGRKMDAGPVILRHELDIDPEDTAVTLGEKLACDSALLLLEGVRLIEKGTFNLEGQKEGLATYAPKLTKKDGCIDWDQPAHRIRDRIRGVQPWPGAFTCFHGTLLKLFPSVAEDKGNAAPGTILEVSPDAIRVSCRDSSLIVREIQPQSKRKMSVREFISGHRLKAGDCFSPCPETNELCGQGF